MFQFNKPRNRFILDSIFILSMWIFLLLSESFIVFKTIHNLYLKNIIVPKYLVLLYIIFLITMYFINGLGCLNVWKSIHKNMNELKYYD